MKSKTIETVVSCESNPPQNVSPSRLSDSQKTKTHINLWVFIILLVDECLQKILLLKFY